MQALATQNLTFHLAGIAEALEHHPHLLDSLDLRKFINPTITCEDAEAGEILASIKEKLLIRGSPVEESFDSSAMGPGSPLVVPSSSHPSPPAFNGYLVRNRKWSTVQNRNLQLQSPPPSAPSSPLPPARLSFQ